MATQVGEFIQQETDRRISEMESSEYVFPPKASKWDWVAIGLVGLACIALIVKAVLELS